MSNRAGGVQDEREAAMGPPFRSENRNRKRQIMLQSAKREGAMSKEGK